MGYKVKVRAQISSINLTEEEVESICGPVPIGLINARISKIDKEGLFETENNLQLSVQFDFNETEIYELRCSAYRGSMGLFIPRNWYIVEVLK